MALLGVCAPCILCACQFAPDSEKGRASMEQGFSSLLENFARRKMPQPPNHEDIEDQVLEELAEIMKDNFHEATTIPRFHKRPFKRFSCPAHPTAERAIQRLYHRIVTEEVMLDIQSSLPTQDVLQRTFDLIFKNSKDLLASQTVGESQVSKEEDISGRTMAYDAFLEVGELLTGEFPQTAAVVRELFSPTVFLALAQEAPREHGEAPRVLVGSVLQFLLQALEVIDAMVVLHRHDADGDGFLDAEEAEKAVHEISARFGEELSAEDMFRTFYVCSVTRAFFFFLDPAARGALRILDVVASPHFLRFLATKGSFSVAFGADWFALEAQRRTIELFAALDQNGDGLVGAGDLRELPDQEMTDLFLERVLEVSQTFRGQIDFRGFVDLQLATRYRREPASQRFFFRALDLHGLGYLTKASLMSFLGELVERLRAIYIDGPPEAEDIADEIFDQINPRDPLRISLEDILASGYGHLLGILALDAFSFVDYDQREQSSGGEEHIIADELDSPPSSPEATALERRQRVNSIGSRPSEGGPRAARRDLETERFSPPASRDATPGDA
eukprot:gnl/Chilomastix_cuspidata/542.p1 GENE.gnl/Chilomastix_cuspidata/542~~gnl/Chilomastix_cuspidata/542.p1  ORF type:complete len:560 (+),score=290.95 gnl/Chilomastix_cuspidata/542:1119-2798(+)